MLGAVCDFAARPDARPLAQPVPLPPTPDPDPYLDQVRTDEDVKILVENFPEKSRATFLDWCARQPNP